MASSDPRADSKRQILDHLKRVDTAEVTELAQRLAITTAAVRQHLEAMEQNGLVTRSEVCPTGGRGRPAAPWKLTPIASDLFPDRHSDLTVELIRAIRAAVGESGLDKVISERTARQRDTYGAVVGTADVALSHRVHRLAGQRAAEGYLAEVTANADGTFELVEHHCPICDAAETCSNLCRDELSLFQDILGPEVEVERTTHLLSGDNRCSYTITPVSLG